MVGIGLYVSCYTPEEHFSLFFFIIITITIINIIFKTE